jgi:site-specific recombinase XerC
MRTDTHLQTMRSQATFARECKADQAYVRLVKAELERTGLSGQNLRDKWNASGLSGRAEYLQWLKAQPTKTNPTL